jgi:hypothetical protein
MIIFAALLTRLLKIILLATISTFNALIAILGKLYFGISLTPLHIKKTFPTQISMSLTHSTRNSKWILYLKFFNAL